MIRCAFALISLFSFATVMYGASFCPCDLMHKDGHSTNFVQEKVNSALDCHKMNTPKKNTNPIGDCLHCQISDINLPANFYKISQNKTYISFINNSGQYYNKIYLSFESSKLLLSYVDTSFNVSIFSLLNNFRL